MMNKVFIRNNWLKSTFINRGTLTESYQLPVDSNPQKLFLILKKVLHGKFEPQIR